MTRFRENFWFPCRNISDYDPFLLFFREYNKIHIYEKHEK